MSRCEICGRQDPNPYHGHAIIREAVPDVRRHATPVVPADPIPRRESMPEHHIDIHHVFQADCDCGWVGPERDRRTDALEDADRHETGQGQGHDTA